MRADEADQTYRMFAYCVIDGRLFSAVKGHIVLTLTNILRGVLS